MKNEIIYNRIYKLAIITVFFILLILVSFMFILLDKKCADGTFESDGVCVPFRSDMQRELYLGNDLNVATTF